MVVKSLKSYYTTIILILQESLEEPHQAKVQFVSELSKNWVKLISMKDKDR